MWAAWCFTISHCPFVIVRGRDGKGLFVPSLVRYNDRIAGDLTKFKSGCLNIRRASSMVPTCVTVCRALVAEAP